MKGRNSFKKTILCTEVTRNSTDQVLCGSKVRLQMPSNFYDGFAFKDRITNQEFKFGDIRTHKMINLQFDEWLSEADQKENAAKIYSQTKKFEMKCIRNKYLSRVKAKNSQKQLNQGVNSRVPNKMGKRKTQSMEKINRQQLRRVLQKGGNVDAEVIEMNSSRAPEYLMNRKKRPKKWRRVQTQPREVGVDPRTRQLESRFKERVLNHMRCEFVDESNYLIPMTAQQKSRQLVANLVRSHTTAQQARQKNRESRDLRFEGCIFEEIKMPPHFAVAKKDKEEQVSKEAVAFLGLVSSGFLHQVELKLVEDPSLCRATDSRHNNAYHIAAKEGNIDMIELLLKTLPTKQSVCLLNMQNNMKRNPVDKALILGNTALSKRLCQFLAEHNIS